MDQVEHIKTQLRTRGGVQETIVDDEAAKQWRTDARAAARQLRRPVETVRHGEIVVAGLRDWPANELEQQVHDASLHNVIKRIWSDDAL